MTAFWSFEQGHLVARHPDSRVVLWAWATDAVLGPPLAEIFNQLPLAGRALLVPFAAAIELRLRQALQTDL